MSDRQLLAAFSAKELLSLLKNPVVEKRHPLITDMDGMRTLNLFGAGLTNAQWKYYAHTVKPVGIEKIHFGNLPLTQETITQLEGIERFSDLKEVEFDNEIYFRYGTESKTYEWDDFLSILSTAKECKSLKHITFVHSLIANYPPLRTKEENIHSLFHVLEHDKKFAKKTTWKPSPSLEEIRRKGSFHKITLVPKA